MTLDFGALGKKITDLIVTTGKEAGVDVSADFKKYAKSVGTWAAKATAAGDLEMLRTCEGILKLLAGKNGIKIQKKGIAVAVQVVQIVLDALFTAMGVV